MSVLSRLEELKALLKIEEKNKKIKELEAEMREPSFWLSEENSQGKSKELKRLKDEVKNFNETYELAQIASDEEAKSLEGELNKLEIIALFSGKYDGNNAILNFYAGAGGVDAQDWTEMLLKMYLGWAEKNEMGAKILSQTPGGEAGIKSATIEISGSYAYGKLKGEDGVHRLVRQSPFNAKNLRQTSFSLVEVLPEVETETEVLIDSKEIKIDTFRAGGHGGQSVNTTDSAVRITHLSTGVVASCQNERSQLQNKENAMKVLRSRLAQLLEKQHKEKVSEIKGDYSSPEWGNQIRSYVLHPYKMVKDHRTEEESKDPDKVLSGEIDKFIEAELKQIS